MQFADQNPFKQKSHDQVNDIIDQEFLAHSIPNVSSNFITGRKAWK